MDEFYVNIPQRLDRFLAFALNISRNKAINLIKGSNVFVNEILVLKPSLRLNLSDKVKVNCSNIENKEKNCEIEFDIPIIYEDDDLLVINKPSGITVHPAPSVTEPTLVDWLKAKNYTLSTLNGEIRAGIVHRLDKGTSGVMIVAKNNIAHAKLSKQLSDKTMGRIYLACINLNLKENCIIEKAIGRNLKNRLKKAIVKDGRYAKSAFLNIYNDKNLNLIAAKLFTGRTHQIRVHLASINRHILGDYLYGFKSENDKILRVMLHAYLIYFIHPLSKKIVEFSAEIPGEFKELIENSKFKEQIYENILPNSLNCSFDDCNNWMCIN